MTVNVPMVDIVMDEVRDKLQYFEATIDKHTERLSGVLADISAVKVADVENPAALNLPPPAAYEPLKGLEVPKLEATPLTPPIIDIGDIERPEKIPVVATPNIDIDIPDAPIFNNQVKSPIELENLLPNVTIEYDLPTAPAHVPYVIDKGIMPNRVDISKLLDSLDVDDLIVPDAPDAPILNLPTAPALNFGDAPEKPNVKMDVQFPDKPTVVLPEMGKLREIVLPDFKFEELPKFTDTPPEFTATIPDNIDEMLAEAKAVLGKDYYASNKDNAIKPLVVEIRAWLDGTHLGTGLPAAVETALFNRARERDSIETERSVMVAIDQWASRGFSLPQGALDQQIATIREQGRLKAADLNRDIMVQSMEKQLEHLRFLTEQGMALEKMKQDLWLAYVKNMMDLAKFTIDSKIQILNAQISVFNARMEAFKSLIDVYKTKIEAAISRITAYRAQIDAQVAIGQINQQEVEIFKAKIDAVMSNVEIYKAMVQGETARVGLITAQFDAYKTEVQAFSEKIGAEKVKVEAFDSQVKAESTKATMYESLARMYASTVQGISAKSDITVKNANLKIEAARVQLQEYSANVDAYKTDVAASVSLAQNNTAVFAAKVDAYKTQSDVAISKVNSQVSLVDMTAKTKIAFAETNARFADMNLRTNIANSEALSRFADMRSRTNIAVAEAFSKHADLQLRTNLANSDSYIKYVESRMRASIAGADMQTKYAEMGMRTNLAYAETNARYADMQLRTGIANAETQARYTDMTVRTNLAYAEMEIKAYESRLRDAQQKAELALEALKAVGAYSAQLAAGAMSAAHVSASMSANGSLSGSVSESTSTSTSHNYSY